MRRAIGGGRRGRLTCQTRARVRRHQRGHDASDPVHAGSYLTLPLDQVAEGYPAMDERRAIKTLLQP